MKKFLTTTIAMLAVVAMTGQTFAACREREVPVPPTIIPGYTEVVPDIDHPEVVIHNPDAKVPFTEKLTRWEIYGDKFCVRELRDGSTRLDKFFKPGCLEPWDTRSMASNINRGGVKIVKVPDTIIPAYTEVVPDIDHPEQVIPNPPKTEHQNGVYIPSPHHPPVWVGFGPWKDGACH